jgi:extradiol dioxygenase family protein
VEPILHLSLPVADLDRARDFYVELLGCPLGRVRERWLDVWFYGLQLTLQDDPDHVLASDAVGVRHFGVTLDGDVLAALVTRLRRADVDWVHQVAIDYAGTPEEQTKAKLRDPDGNVIELKSYARPAVGLGPAAPSRAR